MSGLGNEDFRKLVAESKPKGKAAAKKKKPQTDKEKEWKKKQQEEDDGSVKYRDRAEERRRGLNTDYEELHREQKERGMQWEKFSAEETKFLGGDMDRAHLVKGLDYQLLHKVKTDKPAADDADAATEAGEAPAVVHPSAFTTAMGRAVYDTLFRPPVSSVAEMFKPERMAYVFFDAEGAGAVESEGGVSSIPYTLIRSKADCPEPLDCMNAAPDAAVLSEVVGIMRAVKLEAASRSGKASKRAGAAANQAGALDTSEHLAQVQQDKERRILNLRMIANPRLAAEAAAQRPLAVPAVQEKVKAVRGVDEDVSIFDDVDDEYDPSSTAHVPASAAAQGKQSYFGARDDMRDLPKVAQHGTSLGNERDRPNRGTSHPPNHPSNSSGAPPPYRNAQPGYNNTGGAHAQAHGQGGQWAQQGGMGPPAARTPGGVGGTSGVGGASRGTGFTARMGDRATVRHQFSQEQRNAEDGKGGVGSMATDDVYGVDLLLGGGGLDEEDEDLNQMDAKGRTLNRADFETDEQFNTYKSAREAAPKAAFQFGVKVQDGRRSHKDMDRKQNNKVDNQLGKIQKVFHDKGYKAGSAFQEGDAAAAATPSRKKARLAGI